MRLEEQQDGGTAKGKVAFFLTAEHINAGISLVMVYNFPTIRAPISIISTVPKEPERSREYSLEFSL